MHKAILFEDRGVTNWLPLTYWRSFASLEWGIKTVASHLSDTLQLDIESWWTSPWTADVSQSRCSCPVNQQIDAEGSDAIVFVNMRWLPDIANGKDGNGLRLAQAMEEVAQGHGHGTAGVLDGKMAWLALNRATARTHTPDSMFAAVDLDTIAGKATRVACDGQWLDYPWDALDKRVELINAYYDQINGDSAASGVVMAGDRVQLHGTAVVRDEEGPVILADGVTIGPNAVVDGPIIIGANTRINPHAHLHGGNIIGGGCKLGGEIDGCIIQPYTNKQHAGFLGHSVVGSWVNLGAGFCNSDLKNTYGSVRVPVAGESMDTGSMFFGAVIGDHVKLGINASLPTGSWVGFGSQAGGRGLLPKFIPTLRWLVGEGDAPADPKKLTEIARTVMLRRSIEMTDAEASLFAAIPELASRFETPSKGS